MADDAKGGTPQDEHNELWWAGHAAGFIDGKAEAQAELAQCRAEAAVLCADGAHYLYLKSVIDLINELDCHDDIHWNEKDGKAYAWVICNDLFWWGCADGEEIMPGDFDSIRLAYKDSKHFNGGILWCARKRKMRPQGAYYKHLKDDALLFDACGPERKKDFGNPIEQDAARKSGGERT